MNDVFAGQQTAASQQTTHFNFSHQRDWLGLTLYTRYTSESVVRRHLANEYETVKRPLGSVKDRGRLNGDCPCKIIGMQHDIQMWN